ncbi:MAG: hypothetical protein IKV57_08065 [Clostridia bacterium]|nr:hypothetical protein [Clostridia bacterium]
MTYYPPQNPNDALVVPRRERPALRAIRLTFIVLLSVLFVLSTLLTLFAASVHLTITPEYVYRFAGSLDFTEFPLPVNGAFQSIAQLMLDAFNDVGFNLTESDIELLFDQFSIPTIMAGFAQDFTSWFLHGGSRPVLDPEEIAAIALSGVDSSIMTILYFLGDPVALVGQMLANPLAQLDTDSLFDTLEPVRTLLSVHTFSLLASVSAMLAVLLFCLCRCRFAAFCLPAAISGSVISLCLLAAGFVPALFISRFTIVYAPYILDFLSPVTTFFWRAAIVGGIVSLVLFSVWLLTRLLSHRPRQIPDRWENSGF